MASIERLQTYFNTNAATHSHSPVPVVEELPQTILLVLDSMAAAGVLARNVILTCTPTTFIATAPVPGLTFMILSEQSPSAAVRANLDTNAQGFDPDAAPATEAEALAFRNSLRRSRACTALLDGCPIAAGMFTPPVQGVTELTGIATLTSYRRRGIGTALTSELTRSAFAQGVDTVILRTNNASAFRVYRRIGFYPAACVAT